MKDMANAAADSAVPITRAQPGQTPTKSPWYGTYVRRLSISKESGKGMNVMDLYPYSNPGNVSDLMFSFGKKSNIDYT